MNTPLVIIQNADFEGPGRITTWARARGVELRIIRAYDLESFPPIQDIEGAVILGGPLSVSECHSNPWLIAECGFVNQCFRRNVKILGICFGAQLLAHLLGAEVYPSRIPEIGWHNVGFGDSESATLFVWHREEFSLPPGATTIASTAACSIHGFSYGTACGLVPHIEIDNDLVEEFVRRCWDDSQARGDGIQLPREILAQSQMAIVRSEDFVYNFLDKMFLGLA